MKHVLERKLRSARKRVAKYRKEGYMEIARKEKRNVRAIKAQLRILDGLR